LTTADTPPAVIAAAQRLHDSCRCNWAADDQNVVIAWLVAHPTAPGLSMRLEQRGTAWRLEKQ